MSISTKTNEEILEIVYKSAQGDVESLRLFFEIFSKDIYNFPIRIFHLSEDDASDYFIYAFERLKTGKRFQSFVGKSSFRTWFFSVLRNLLIDWQRTKRELKIRSLNKVNKEGEEYATIEDAPDLRPAAKLNAEYISEKFQSVLQEIKIESRLVFKLSFIYYLHLDTEEIGFIASKNHVNSEDIIMEILKLRESLVEKEEENLRLEDKITSLYLNILDLKEERIQKIKDYPEDASFLSERLNHSLNKKYEQRRKLIEKKWRGHFLVRTPYREICRILKVSEGGVSVTLLRVIEKIRKKNELFNEKE